MLFNSGEFFLFFFLFVSLYYVINSKYRWCLLLCSSYLFYMSWKPIYALLIVFSTIIDYFCSLKIANTNSKRRKKLYLYLSLSFNLGVLLTFKYLYFFMDSYNKVAYYFDSDSSLVLPSIILPMGISFYTFQTMSYTIDVYKGKIEPERHFGIFALFVTFFPQLVAGPIERASDLLPQFKKKNNFDYERVTSGLRLMAWGFFKKVVIADRIAAIVNPVYNQVELFNGGHFFIATLLFSFQIYCDFSGYSDIAIGIAKVIGFNLSVNFKRPYNSESMSELWKRWHITLSGWFRDYVYIPLGGNRVGISRIYLNLLITFLISGLWHGANWTFVIWGALHGIYLIIEIVLGKMLLFIAGGNKMNFSNYFFKVARVVLTFSLTSFAWIFFRANSLSDAVYIVNEITSISFELSYWVDVFKSVSESKIELGIAFSLIFILQFIYLFDKEKVLSLISNSPVYLRYLLYGIFIFIILLLGKWGSQDFIYFQF